MNIYMIEAPYLSSKQNICYNKKLEIFEYELLDEAPNNPYMKHVVKFIQAFQYKKDAWVKFDKKMDSESVNIEDIHNEPIKEYKYFPNIYFYKFHHAEISKHFMYENNINEAYRKKIVELQQKLDQKYNSSHFKKLKEKYPEEFV